MNRLLIINLIAGLLFVSCSKTEIPADISSPPRQILEINSNFTGLYWMNGRVTDFRLYDDGTAEYDEYPLSAPGREIIKAEEARRTKRIRITDAELRQILDLLKSPEFADAGVEYQPQKSCLDAFIDTTIEADVQNGQKQILLRNHCLNLQNREQTSYFFNNFPEKLNDLFRKINEIKNKESAGKFYY